MQIVNLYVEARYAYQTVLSRPTNVGPPMLFLCVDDMIILSVTP